METDFNPNKLTYGFIGLGLIGGSMAKALRKVYPGCTIIAYNRSAAPRLMALEDKTVNIAVDTVDETFSQCDFIFLCTPVEFNETYLDKLSLIMKKNCILTDVGSVKGNIHSAVKARNMEKNFIGGHPMAGSEKTGYEHSSPSLCVGSVYPITPTSKNDDADIKRYEKIISDIGFKPVIMSPELHDETTAAISHLPHLIAAELSLLVRDSDTENHYMQLLASTGFKDTTRIAASSADVWKQICTANSENISNLLGEYINRLTALKTSLEKKDSGFIENLFAESKKYRDLY